MKSVTIAQKKYKKKRINYEVILPTVLKVNPIKKPGTLITQNIGFFKISSYWEKKDHVTQLLYKIIHVPIRTIAH